MKLYLNIAQIILSVALVAAILLQARGAGLSATFGGEPTAYRSRRGIEKTLFRLTIALVVVYVIVSLASVMAQ